MAIQVRRGNEADFDASKMLPGEWAVSLDTRYVRMCFAPGLVLRMSTYESFEADMAQIQEILLECRTIQSAVQRIQAEVNAKASLTIEYSNSAKKYADNAYAEAERAKTYADNAEAVTGVQIATKDKAGLIKGGDNHIAEDGTLMLITPTDQTTMPNSYDGRFLFKKIKGVGEQGENPSPTSPQEVKNSVVSGVKTHGKNYFKPDVTSDTIFGITHKVEEDGTCILNGTATESRFITLGKCYDLKPNIAYTLNGNSTTSPVLRLRTFDVNGNKLHEYIVSTSEKTFTTEENFSYADVYVIVYANTTVNNLVIYPMIRKADITDATYEPYKESSITLSNPIDLYGIGDVQDVIGVERGVHLHNCGYELINSITGGYPNSVGTYIGYVANKSQVGDDYSISSVFCDKLPATSPHNQYAKNLDGIALSSNNRILISFKDVTTYNDFIARLNELGGIYVLYPLATPTEEELPIADQIALNSLATYDGITYLEFIVEEEVQPTFEGEYGTSKVGGMTLESLLTARNNDLRLSSLEASVVNNI